MGWELLRNGALLSAAAADRFEVFITVDRNLKSQQHPASLPIAVIVLAAGSSRLTDLTPLVP